MAKIFADEKVSEMRRADLSEWLLLESGMSLSSVHLTDGAGWTHDTFLADTSRLFQTKLLTVQIWFNSGFYWS